jgi:predicted amidohydrolase YtcJ
MEDEMTRTRPKFSAPKNQFRSAILVAAMLALVTPLRSHAQSTGPDLIIHNAKIVTVDRNFSIAQAAAVQNGMFVAVGSDADILASAGPDTMRIDMHHRTILPGFSDTHVHVLSGTTFPHEVDVTEVKSIGEMQHAIAERAKTMKPGAWIPVSRGWWDYKLAERRNPTKEDLDAAAPKNPVALQVTHYSIVNSAALQAGNITRDTPNPSGGAIGHDPRTGEANGLLMDRASALLHRPREEVSPEEAYNGVRAILAKMNGHGITSARQPGGTLEDAAMFLKMYGDGNLTMRIDFCYSMNTSLRGKELDDALDRLGRPGQAYGSGMFRADCLAELSLDGAAGITEFMREDYPGRPGYRGLQMVKQDQYNEFAIAAAKHGWRLAVHAGGDAAIDEALEAFEKAGAKGHRWSLEHAISLRPDQYERVKNNEVLINSQYAHNAEGGKKTLDGWGPEWANQTERYKDWLEHGVEFSAGSDGPISYRAEPMLWMYGMVTRDTEWGGSLAPDQKITREQAIRSMTSISAGVSFEENIKGSIEAGKYADFVVLSKDILTVPEKDIKVTQVLATVLGGKTVYGDLKKAASTQ